MERCGLRQWLNLASTTLLLIPTGLSEVSLEVFICPQISFNDFEQVALIGTCQC